LATPEPIKDWSLTSLNEKLIKIGAKVVRHGRYVAFPIAEVAVPRHFRRHPSAHRGTAAAAGQVNSVTKFSLSRVPRKRTGGLRLDGRKIDIPRARNRQATRPGV
jgi:hypothetical protein